MENETICYIYYIQSCPPWDFGHPARAMNFNNVFAFDAACILSGSFNWKQGYLAKLWAFDKMLPH